MLSQVSPRVTRWPSPPGGPRYFHHLTGHSRGPTSWPNVAANRLAVRVACNLDIDVPESPDDLAPVGESPATTEDSGCELETDDAGQTWEVCPDGSRTFVGGGL